jgi:hypothetical protein
VLHVSRLVFVTLAATAVSCATLVGFGEKKKLDEGSGGAGGDGGMSGVGGDGGSPPYYCDPDGDIIWLRTFGDASYQVIHRIAEAPNSGIYATGRFTGSIDFGQGPIVSEGSDDLYVARFDTQGKIVWANRYGKNLADTGTPTPAHHPKGVALFGATNEPLDFGGGEYTPTSESAGFVTLLSAEGAHLWTTWLDGPGETFALTVTVDPGTEDVIVFGAFNGQLQLGNTTLDSVAGNDAMIVRLAADDGAVLDSLSIGGPGGDWARSVQVTADGRVAIAGSTTGPIDFGFGLEPSEGGADSYAALLNANLEFIWGRIYAYPGYQHFEDAALAPNGDMITIGRLATGTVDVGNGPQGSDDSAYITRLSMANGDVVDGVVIEGFKDPWAIAVDAVGNIVATGEYRGTLTLGVEQFQSVDGVGDPVTFSLSPSYFVRWRDVVVGSFQSEGFSDVMIDGQGDVVVGGWFHHELPLEGCSVRVSNGDADVALYKRKM